MPSLKILIILDIQNCNMTNKYQISDIETLIDENTLIIFTQNSYSVEHPIKFLYISMYDYDVDVPTDINITSNCNSKFGNNFKFNLDKNEIQFAELSKKYFKKYGNVIDELNISNKSYIGTTSFPNTIGYKCNYPYNCAKEPIKYTFDDTTKDKKISNFKGLLYKVLIRDNTKFCYHLDFKNKE